MSGRNSVILAAAGSRKTEHIVDSALKVEKGRVLITTFTNENQQQIVQRIHQKVGAMPENISVMGWFTFLITQCAKPYQRALTGTPLVIRNLNFKGKRDRGTKKHDVRRYFFDKQGNILRDGAADFAVQLTAATDGAVIDRLERIYSHIFIDEVQDLVGWDLDLLDLLMASKIDLTMVGDPRQHTLETSVHPKNQKYRGVGLTAWFAERQATCTMVERTESYRCNQAICDFADGIFPDMPRTQSVNVGATGHDGIFTVKRSQLLSYVEEHGPVTVLRHSKSSDTLGLPAMNFGVAKGSTFDRVVIFPTKSMRDFITHGDPTKLNEAEKLYVAVTRARWSVAFVLPD